MAESHRATPNRVRHLFPAQSGGRRMSTAPNRTGPEARNEATSDISRLRKKKLGLATLSRRKPTTNTPNTITDRCPGAEKGHRKRETLRLHAGRRSRILR